MKVITANNSRLVTVTTLWPSEYSAHSLCLSSCICVRTAPNPVSLASVSRIKGLWSGNAKTGAITSLVRIPSNAIWHSFIHSSFAVFYVRRWRDLAMPEKSFTTSPRNCCTSHPDFGTGPVWPSPFFKDLCKLHQQIQCGQETPPVWHRLHIWLV